MRRLPIHRLAFQYQYTSRPRTAALNLIQKRPYSVPRQFQTPSRLSNKGVQSQASYTSYTLILVIACGSAIAFDYYTQSSADPELPEAPISDVVLVEDNQAPDYSKMATPEGYVGNLTPEQEQKLQEFWAITLKTFGVQDQDSSRPHPNGNILNHGADTPASASENESSKTTPKKHTKRLSLFGRKKDDETVSPGRNSISGDDDKYGQTAELRQILSTQTPESLRTTFWSMVKCDHPDGLLLRFLRARKWDVDRALAMMISTMNWRSEQMHVDDDIMLNGEGGAHTDEMSTDPSVKREGADFLAQLRMGKSFLHGVDKEGRPLTYVRARLHKGGEQTERALERYTVHTIETARLALRPPVETACIIFDMTHFTLANMDYTPVKFMIKIFEANYPESLGAVLVHKAPWVFQGIWKIIKGWLDPVVAAKVHFTNSVEDMEVFIPRSQIVKELGGSVDWEYKYLEPVDGENDRMKDTATRDQLLHKRVTDVLSYQQKTFDWIASSQQGAANIKGERDSLAKRLNENYWQLDPYIRARSIYDRTGFLQPGGKINFFPDNTLKITGNTAPPVQETHSDDVD